MNEPPQRWVRIGTPESLTFDPGHCATVEGREIAIFEADGKYFALDNSCPHEGGALAEGDIEDGEVLCPWHGWRYQLTTGECMTVPEDRVACYSVRVVDGHLEVAVPA